MVDATLGGGGYTLALLQRVRPGGSVLALDRDASAIARFPLERVPPDVRLRLVHANFADLGRVARELPGGADGIIFDLGMSSMQLDDPERGFSFQRDGPLDMRLDQSEPWTAADLLNREPASELRRILLSYGQERWGARIAERIVARRARQLFRTTKDLVDVVTGAIPGPPGLGTST